MLIFVFLQQKIIAYQCEISKNVMIFVKVEKTFFPFFFERFDRNLIASSLFQKNKKIRKSVFALLVCCLLMTFSPKNQENHNFFLAVASYNQIEYFSIFFMISKCRESSGANTKNI